jgi:hypothetical protein
MRMEPAPAPGAATSHETPAQSSNTQPPVSQPTLPSAPACTEAALRCSESMPGQRERCQSGAWMSLKVCAAGEICVNSDDDALCLTLAEACHGHEGQNVCNDAGEMLMCDAHGSATPIDTCADPRLCMAGIAQGACASCIPGSHKCNGSQLQTCSSSGGGYELQEACASQALCDEEKGRCAPALCERDEYICQGDSLKRCDSALNAFEAQRQCGPGLCDQANKTCRVCMPGQRKCSGDTRQECDGSGQSFVAAACPAATPLCTGAGSCTECRVSSDCAAHPCQVSSCLLGSCSYAPEPRGTPACNIPDGSTIKVNGSDAIYVVVGGAKFWIHSTDDLEGHFGGYAKTMVVDSAVLDSCHAVPAAGTNVQELNGPDVDRIGRDGQFHHILHVDDLVNTCGGIASVQTIPPGGLAENGIGRGSDI